MGTWVHSCIYMGTWVHSYLYMGTWLHSCTADVCKATPEERKDASEALAKYDILTDDEQRARFQNYYCELTNFNIECAILIEQ